ncbi:hypothetical protein XENOCAPTIV_027137, partial [Xenoophorus captivus]
SEDGDAGNTPKHQRASCQKQHGGLPEFTGHFPKCPCIRPAADPHSMGSYMKAAAVEAEGWPVFPDTHIAGLRPRQPQKPIRAHEGHEFHKSHHDAKQGPKHGAACYNNVAHIFSSEKHQFKKRALNFQRIAFPLNRKVSEVPRLNPDGLQILSSQSRCWSRLSVLLPLSVFPSSSQKRGNSLVIPKSYKALTQISLVMVNSEK